MGDNTRPEEERGEAGFEKELENLERVVGLLERGELGLEEAIRQYESGHESLKRCYRILESAQKRIEVLSGASFTPFQAAGFQAAGFQAGGPEPERFPGDAGASPPPHPEDQGAVN